MKSILEFLRSIGRKYAFVDFYGDVIFYRYYVFYDEEKYGDKGGFWPNILIHEFPGDPEGEGPDAEHIHAHPYSTLSYIIKGGYTEQVDDGFALTHRETKAGQFTNVPYTSYHRIKTVEPGTVTLFMHWFRRSTWRLRIQKCSEVCSVCWERNSGQCYRHTNLTTLNNHLDSTSPSEGDEWRGVKWLQCGPDFEQQLAKRKKTLRRMGINIPENMRLKRDALKIYEIVQGQTDEIYTSK